MRRWIAIGDVAIPSTSDDLPAAYDHRAYGDFAGFERALGGAQGFLHPKFVGSSDCSLVVNGSHRGPYRRVPPAPGDTSEHR
jgi:hypothetical protein